MQLASFTQPVFGGIVDVPYTLGDLSSSGKALLLSTNSVVLVVGGGYYIVESQTPSNPTSSTGTVRLQNWSGAQGYNADPSTLVPAGSAYPQTAFSAVLPNKSPLDGNGTIIVSKTPSAVVPGTNTPPTNKTVLYGINQIDLAAFTMPNTGSTVTVNVSNTNPRTTWQDGDGTEAPLTFAVLTDSMYIRTAAGLMQIVSHTPTSLTLKNTGAQWNRGPSYAVKAGPAWATSPSTTTALFNLVSSDDYGIKWNGQGADVYLPWGINPDVAWSEG